LTLRPCTESDIGTLHALWSDPDVRRWLWDDRITELKEVQDLVAESLESFRTRDFGLWMAEREGRVVGFCGLRDATDWLPGQIELLYGLEPKYWGLGYATEASVALLGHAFDVIGLDQVVAAADSPNEGSVRVLERIGMTLEREGYIENLPTKFFSLKKEDFVSPQRGG